MASGSRRKRGDEYVFVDGRAMRSSDAMGAGVQETAVPGREQAGSVPGADAQRRGDVPGSSADAARRGGRNARALREMAHDDAFALRDDARAGQLLGGASLMGDDKRKMRRLYLGFGIVLLACVCVSLCADPVHLTFWSPAQVVDGLGHFLSISFADLFRPQDAADLRAQAMAASPQYGEIATQFGNTFKFVLCGFMLAVSGMLYQNAFRNPIAAPSMLGVTSGVNMALVVLVMQFGELAYQHLGLYYLYSYIGGALVLALVMLGGKWTSGKRKFNVVNMILIGTIVSQLLGVLITYIENNFMSDVNWMVFNEISQALDITSVWTYLSLLLGAVAAFVPIFLFRFRLNLVSFSDEETKFLGVNPNKLRLLALGCGSIMILTAQVNAGQVAMVSLVVPFVVRAVFGSEFRKQLGGNLLVGAIVLVVCGLLSDFIIINQEGVGLGAVTTLVALPLFVWMLAIRQRSWD